MKKNQHAAALARLRAKKLTKKRRSEIARLGGLATAAKRKESASISQVIDSTSNIVTENS